jgi:hypothetical protein
MRSDLKGSDYRLIEIQFPGFPGGTEGNLEKY